MTITLYDIPSANPTNAWSPNTFKARLAVDALYDTFTIHSTIYDEMLTFISNRTALVFKGVPFKTEWVEYPDIEGKMKGIGAAATGTWKDGRPQYTLPVIKDDATGKIVSDSLAIAKYLDATYPSHPTLLPLGASAPVDIYEEYFTGAAIAPAMLLLLAESNHKLNPKSEAYFRRTREESYGLKIEEFAPPGPKREAVWASVKAGLSKVSAKLGGSTYFYGNTVSYADLVAVSYLLWMKIVVPAAEWKEVEGWDEGRWAKLLAATEKYQVVA